MRISQKFMLLSAVLLLSLSLLAAEVTGKWKGPMQSGGDATFDLKSDKGTVSGNMIGYDGKPYPISDGKLDGENLSMKVAFEWQGQPVTLLVTGKVAGEQMDVHIATDNGYWSTDASLKKQK